MKKRNIDERFAHISDWELIKIIKQEGLQCREFNILFDRFGAMRNKALTRATRSLNLSREDRKDYKSDMLIVFIECVNSMNVEKYDFDKKWNMGIMYNNLLLNLYNNTWLREKQKRDKTFNIQKSNVIHQNDSQILSMKQKTINEDYVKYEFNFDFFVDQQKLVSELLPWQKKIIHLRLEGYNIGEIQKSLNLSYGKIREFIYSFKEKVMQVLN